jgi:hypothetical protein
MSNDIKRKPASERGRRKVDVATFETHRLFDATWEAVMEASDQELDELSVATAMALKDGREGRRRIYQPIVNLTPAFVGEVRSAPKPTVIEQLAIEEGLFGKVGQKSGLVSVKRGNMGQYQRKAPSKTGSSGNPMPDDERDWT